MDGILVIDKPAGPTSFDVVRRVRSLLKVQKAGHTGTLDPIATGVLPICLGEATKIAGFITEGNKSYDAVIRFGIETDTQDSAGKVLAEKPAPHLDKEMLETALNGFRGALLQTPPMYSAVKINGKRLYELARAGEEVERAARQVTVHELILRDFSSTEATVSVQSSKGFYVRAMAHDLGRVLGCGGHLKSLRRTANGAFTLAQSIGLDQLMREKDATPYLIPVSQALNEIPPFIVSRFDAERVVKGIQLEANGRQGRFRILDGDGKLIAMGEASAGKMGYARVFKKGL